MRSIGIDEAGYGPNLGPMVMTAVIAEGNTAPIDLWLDLALTIDRAGGDPTRLWVDDSKAILHGTKGRDRLDWTALATIAATGHTLPASLPDLISAISVGSPDEAELSPWLNGRETAWPWRIPPETIASLIAGRPLEPPDGRWRLITVESVVVGPARFNAALQDAGSKAEVHFDAFARLLRSAWDRAGDGIPTFVTGDKHGGRHYYLGPLSRVFPRTWIDRGVEGPAASRYAIHNDRRRLELTLLPRADMGNGLVALASIVSKAVRETWMDGFNAYWCDRVTGLRPTAGYPVDARRFRRAIEAAAEAEGLDPSQWWRER